MDLKRIFLALLSLSLAAPAFAADREMRQTTTLLSETVTPLTPADVAAMFPGAPRPDDERIVIAPIMIVLAGAKVWNVIVKGRPSADLASAYASAIPGFAFNWNDMAGWKKVTRRYRFRLGNWLQGDDAADITYEVSFFYGTLATPGTKPERKGHYIANFVIKPEVINLKWGWKVSLTAAMSDPMNVGTPEEPVAMLNADLKWQYTKPLSSMPNIGMDSVAIDGYGSLQSSVDGRLNLPPVPAGTDTQEPLKVRWD